MTTLTTEFTTETKAKYLGNDRLLFGIILGVLAFWLFAQTTLNIAPTMAVDLGIQMSVMNIAVGSGASCRSGAVCSSFRAIQTGAAGSASKIDSPPVWLTW